MSSNGGGRSTEAKKHVKTVLRAAKRAGWRIRHHRGGHIRLYPADKDQPPMTMSVSPSRYTDKMLREARQRGLEV